MSSNNKKITLKTTKKNIVKLMFVLSDLDFKNEVILLARLHDNLSNKTLLSKKYSNNS